MRCRKGGGAQARTDPATPHRAPWLGWGRARAVRGREPTAREGGLAGLQGRCMLASGVGRRETGLGEVDDGRVRRGCMRAVRAARRARVQLDPQPETGVAETHLHEDIPKWRAAARTEQGSPRSSSAVGRAGPVAAMTRSGAAATRRHASRSAEPVATLRSS